MVYLSTVLDDFSRYIIAWKLCTTMKAEDVTATLEMALEAAALDKARVLHARVAYWRGRVGKLKLLLLKLLCILLTAFGIERTVCRLDILEALSGLRNAPSDSEIIGLSFDHQSVSPGRKHEIGDHWT